MTEMTAVADDLDYNPFYQALQVYVMIVTVFWSYIIKLEW